METIEHRREEYLTIIGASAAEVMAQFAERRLAEQGYVIAGRIGRHHFALAGAPDHAELFPDRDIVAATFVRGTA